MSNLGGYQKAVELIKDLGGPKNTVMALVGTGAVIYAFGVATGPQLQKQVENVIGKIKSRSKPCQIQGTTFRVHTWGQSDLGIVFEVGDTYTVLGCDQDAILIEILGKVNNPHIVSGVFLTEISNFPSIDRESGS